ncbi:hypothetical protein ACFC09_25145 [Streptomyces sp. NPDC056161]|uniref:hypothetical protein n=1 Tax=Streptomyces sp. NPDC056161 TaxID=3345732 RepID=UPI0035D84AC6
MPSQSTDASIRSRYVEQAASDLRDNRRRQQELTEMIAALKQEEVLLRNILDVTERFDAPSDGAPSDGAPLPQQAQDEPALVPAAAAPAAPADPRRRATRTAAGPEPGKKQSARASAQVKGRKPLLGDVFLDLLRTHDEPCLAKDLRSELMREHPERTPTPQVVRNTLEALVAKGRIRRHKEQRSVLYSLVEAESAKPVEAVGDTPDGDA